MPNRHAPPTTEEVRVPCGRGAITCQTLASPTVRVVEYKTIGDYNPPSDKVVEAIDRQWGAEGKRVFTFTTIGPKGRLVSGNLDNIARRTSTVETTNGTRQSVWGQRRRVRRDVYESIVERIRRDGDVDPTSVERELAKETWDQQPLQPPPGRRTHWNPAIDSNVERMERYLRGFAPTSGESTVDQTQATGGRGLVDSDRLRHCYAVLGVKPGASLVECKAARQAKLLATHPDQGGKEDGAAQRIKQIMDAYSYIEEWHPREGRRASEVRQTGRAG